MGIQVRVLTGFSAVLVPSALLDTEVERFTVEGGKHGS